MPAGRPSKYSPAYCNEVIDCGARGFSLTAFAGEIGVSRDTISEWMNAHPEFSVACKIAQAKRTLYLEGGMLALDATSPMVTARRFALANAAPDEWREKSHQDHTTGGKPITGPSINFYGPTSGGTAGRTSAPQAVDNAPHEGD